MCQRSQSHDHTWGDSHSGLLHPTVLIGSLHIPFPECVSGRLGIPKQLIPVNPAPRGRKETNQKNGVCLQEDSYSVVWEQMLMCLPRVGEDLVLAMQMSWWLLLLSSSEGGKMSSLLCLRNLNFPSERGGWRAGRLSEPDLLGRFSSPCGQYCGPLAVLPGH